MENKILNRFRSSRVKRDDADEIRIGLISVWLSGRRDPSSSTSMAVSGSARS